MLNLTLDEIIIPAKTMHQKHPNTFTLHWICIVEGLLWAIAFMATGLFFDYISFNYISQQPPKLGYFFIGGTLYTASYFTIFLGLFGLSVLSNSISRLYNTEIILTDDLVIYKRGFMRVKIDKIYISEISAENVNYGMFGFLLGYGKVLLDCRFINDMYLPAIKDPLSLCRAIAELKEHCCDKERNTPIEKFRV